MLIPVAASTFPHRGRLFYYAAICTKEGAIGAPSGHYSDAEIADTKVKAEALAADVEADENFAV